MDTTLILSTIFFSIMILYPTVQDICDSVKDDGSIVSCCICSDLQFVP